MCDQTASIPGNCEKAKRLVRRLPIFRRFVRNERGVTAIEFGFLATPFFMLFMAIIETSLMFFASELLESSVDEISRKVRTGQYAEKYPSGMSEADFKSEVCGEIAFLFDCTKLAVDLQAVNDIDSLQDKPVINSDGELNSDAYGYAEPGAQQVVKLTASYEWPTFSNYMARYMTKLASGNWPLNAIAVFVTEPF